MGQEEWLELESDPGLFTLLVEDLGVRGVQVDEIYELSKVPADPVFGFIFLFRWQQNEKRHNSRRSSRGGTTSLNNSQSSSVGVESSLQFLNLPPGDNSSLSNANNINVTSQHSLNGISPDRRKVKTEFLAESGLDARNPDVFFAHQVVPNSCATHSLLSILMNTFHSGVDLGPLLSEFRRATASLSPSLRGLAIGYMPPLMEAHNRHARQQTSVSHCLPPSCDEITSAMVVRSAVEAAQKAGLAECENGTNGSDGGLAAVDDTPGVVASSTTGDAGDTFHFVCFLPVGRYLYELDGLKQEPINHGLLEDPITHNGWTRQCLDLLKQRMRDQDVRYNLMAVVPDRRMALTSRLDNLEKNRSILEKTIQQLSTSNATAVQVKLEHNGTLEPTSTSSSSDVNGSPANPSTMETYDVQEQQESTEIEPEEPNLDNSEGEIGVDGRPLTRAASRAAAAAVKSRLLKRSTSLAPNTPKKSSLRGFGSSTPSPTSICIDLTEEALSSTNNNALSDEASEGVTTRRRGLGFKETPSKYPTRSSTRRDTLASHSLAHARCNKQEPPNSSAAASTTTTAFLTTDNLGLLLSSIEAQARACSAALAEEEARRQAYRVDAARRIHNYEPFIRAFLKDLKEHGMLQRLVGEANANSSSGRQLRKRRRGVSSLTSATPTKSTTAPKPNWSSSASGSVGSTCSSSMSGGIGDGISAAGGALSRRAVKRARLAAVSANGRPSTRMSTSTIAGNAAISSNSTSPSERAGANRKRTTRRSL
ncbi:hypothetical protein Aperf_G00000090940 [Anoplocephala perfoliata]